MKISTAILLFLSAFATFNGISLSLYLLFFIKHKSLSNKFLAILFFLFSIRVCKSVLIYANPDFYGFYLQLGITVCFFFGPFLYFYLESVFLPEKNIEKNWVNHVIVLLSLAIILYFLFPSIENYILWENYLMNFVYLIWLIYILKAGYIIRNFILKKTKNNYFKNWVLFIYFGNLIIWLAHVTHRYISYSVISLSIGLFIYSLLFFLIFTTHKSNLFSLDRIKSQIAFDSKKENNLIIRLKRLMIEEELFKNKDLKSSIVAIKLGIPVYKLSEIINKHHDKNFSNYVNEFRVEFAKELLISNKNNYTIEAIGQESGFKSKSSFYNAFKRITGKTPSNFA